MIPRPNFRDLLHANRFPLRLIAVVILSTTILILACEARGEDVPTWALRGIAKTESRSVYRADGSIRYVDQRRGNAGERGPFQALPSTLRQFGFSPSLVEQDPTEAERATRAILAHYYEITGDWDECVAAWRKGLGGRGTDTAIAYARRVRAAGSTTTNKGLRQ